MMTFPTATSGQGCHPICPQWSQYYVSGTYTSQCQDDASGVWNSSGHLCWGKDSCARGWQDKYVNNRDCSEKQRRWRWELPLPQWWPLEHETLQTVAVIASQSQTFFCEVFFFLQDVYQSCCQGGCPQLWRCAKAINSSDISETVSVSINCGFRKELFITFKWYIVLLKSSKLNQLLELWKRVDAAVQTVYTVHGDN